MKTATCCKGFILFLLLVCASCHSVSWKNNPLVIVSDRECEAPCWQGMTPGITNFEEAQQLAENVMIKISEDEVILPDKIIVSENKSFLVVRFNTPPISARVEFDQEGIVEGITFRFERKSRPEIGEIIQIFGNPDSITLSHHYFEIRRVFVTLWYPHIGVYFIKKLPITGETFKVPYSLKTRVDYLVYRASPQIPIREFSFPWAEKGVLEFSPEKCNPESDCCKP